MVSLADLTRKMPNDPRILLLSENLRAVIWRADDNDSAAIIYFQAREQPEPVCLRINTAAPIRSFFWEMPSLKGGHWLSLAESQGPQHFAIAIADHQFLDDPFILGLEFETEGDPRDCIISAEVWDKDGGEPQIIYREMSPAV